MKISSVFWAVHLLCSFAYEVTPADWEQSHLQSISGQAVFYGNIVHASRVVILNIYALLHRALWDGTGVIHLQNCVSQTGIQ